ncbi:hypothetical protein JXJ21_09545 [candidate division KSB1 bacterium]|nr:hypothetical protein [candidate division KSB1 bacterium]
MNIDDKTPTQLSHECERLKRRVAELEDKITSQNGMIDNMRQEVNRYKLLLDVTDDFIFFYEFGTIESPGLFLEVNSTACERLRLFKRGNAHTFTTGYHERR